MLLQLEDELRAAFPRVIGDLELMNMWSYKYGDRRSAAGVDEGIIRHADDSAINLNFWITAEEANLDKNSGGLRVWTKPAPLDWPFAKYNNFGTGEEAEAFFADSGVVDIPYRENRAVLFNGNFFHKTARYHFAPGYKNRRINITFLFGKRGQTPVAQATDPAAARKNRRAARKRAKAVQRCQACLAKGRGWCHAPRKGCRGACVANEADACACGAGAHAVSVDAALRDANVRRMVRLGGPVQVGCVNDFPMDSKFYPGEAG